MKINELIQNYNLHDSLIEKIEYDKTNLTAKIYIDFCYWQQENYNERMPETGMIVVVFKECTEIRYENYDINSDEIVKVSGDEHSMTITVFNDLSGKYIDIFIKAVSAVFVNDETTCTL